MLRRHFYCKTRRHVQNMQIGNQRGAILYCRAHRVGAGLQITGMAFIERMNPLSN